VNTTLDTAQKVLGNADKHLDARMKELSIVMQNLKVATTYAKIAFDTIAKRPNRLVFGSRDDELPTEAEILRATKPLPIPEKAKRR
jgi:tRNA(Leu) C34 or U34 (ribose-2'-O)-methylase TrmL